MVTQRKKYNEFILEHLEHVALEKKIDVFLLNDLNISLHDLLVLELSSQKKYTQKEIARLLSISTAGVSKIVYKLVKAGLASVSDLSTDRRANIIAVSESGERKLKLAQTLVNEIVDGGVN